MPPLLGWPQRRHVASRPVPARACFAVSSRLPQPHPTGSDGFAPLQVKAILVNIFGGIMRCDVIASGIVNAAKQVRGTRGGGAAPCGAARSCVAAVVCVRLPVCVCVWWGGWGGG